jgi:hypothetical protein
MDNNTSLDINFDITPDKATETKLKITYTLYKIFDLLNNFQKNTIEPIALMNNINANLIARCERKTELNQRTSIIRYESNRIIPCDDQKLTINLKIKDNKKPKFLIGLEAILQNQKIQKANPNEENYMIDMTLTDLSSNYSSSPTLFNFSFTKENAEKAILLLKEMFIEVIKINNIKIPNKQIESNDSNNEKSEISFTFSSKDRALKSASYSVDLITELSNSNKSTGVV